MSITMETLTDLTGRMRNEFVQVIVTTTAARQTVSSQEAKALVRDNAKANVTAALQVMPESIKAAHKRAGAASRRILHNRGWETKNGSILAYLINITEDLQLVFDEVDEVEREMLGVVAEATKDWQSYRNQCLSAAGDLAIDTAMFPYRNAEEYMNEFKVRLTVQPLPDVVNLPGALVGHLRDQVEASVLAENSGLIEDMVDTLAQECEKASLRIAEGGLLRASTFGTLARAARLAEKIIGEADPRIKRVAPTVQKWVQQIDYSKVSKSKRDDAYAGEVAGAFMKAYTILKTLPERPVDPATEQTVPQ